MLCGDLNCPGGDSVSVDPLLEDLLSSRLLAQRVNGPTHSAGNLLDVVVTAETSTLAGSPTVSDIGFSDHKLVLCDLHVGRPRPRVRQFQYRNIKIVDPVVFAAALRLKSVYTSPSDEVNHYADQLEQAIVEILDELAPKKT